MQSHDENGVPHEPQNRALRLDLLIAICALLISSLGSAASWWQARLLNEQTRVLEQQLGAQVWPYIDIVTGINGKTVSITIRNNGLGPAVLRSETMTVDGMSSSSIIDALHKILGPHLITRASRRDRMRLDLEGDSPGAVLRPGETTSVIALTSEHYAGPFMRQSTRLRFKVCYCAIVPNQCWFTDSSATGEPQPRAACAEIPNDLMHSAASEDRLNALINANF